MSLDIILIIFLGILAFQDFKDRTFWAFLPICIFIGGLLRVFTTQDDFIQIVLMILINLCIVSVILLSLFTYLKFRFKNSSTLIKRMGMGDIVLMYALTPLFLYQEMIIMLITASFTSLLYVFILTIWKRINPVTFRIPFASWISLNSIALLAMNYLKPI